MALPSIFANGSLTLIENLGVGTEFITLDVPSISASYTLTLPNHIGNPGDILSTGITPGTMEWVTVAKSWKHSVKVGSIGSSITLSPAPASIDTVSISTDDRVLLKDQTPDTQNGIYILNGSGDLVRDNDAGATDEASGILVYVTDGPTNGNKIFYCTDPSGTEFDDGITFKEFNINNVMAGPNISTDNAIARFDGTSGNILKNSDVLVDNSGNIIGQTGNIILQAGDIELTSTNRQDITHIGGVGQDLIISSIAGSVTINEVSFINKTMILTETGGGSDTVTLSAPSNVNPSSYTLIFPDSVGTPNQILSTGSTPGTMEWINQTTGAPPGGSDDDVQYNAGGGTFGGNSNFAWDNGSQALTLNGSIAGVTTLGMSGNLTNSAGDILLTNSNVQNITHTGGSGDLIFSSGSNVVVDSVTFNNGAISTASDIGMSGNLTNSAGDILLTNTNSQNITHTGGSGDLIFSSGSNVVVDSVTFNNGAMSGISTVGMSGDLTNSAGDILLTSTSAQNITHTGQSGQDLILSSGGNVVVDTVIFDNGAMSGISTLTVSGNVSSGGDLLLTDTAATSITHTGGSGDLTISSGSNVIVESVTFNNGAVSGISTIDTTGDITTGGNIVLTNTNVTSITHTGGSGDLTISSGSNVVVDNVTFNNGAMSGISDLSMSGTLNLTDTGNQSITHTGGLGDLIFDSGGQIRLNGARISAASDLSNVNDITMSGDLTNTGGNINLSSTSTQNITHTGGSGDLTISSGGNVIVDNVTFNSGAITATGAVRSNDSFILEDPGAGTNTITIQAGTPSASYVVNLPPNNGAANQLLQTDGAGQMSWVNNPSQPGAPDKSIQFNTLGAFTGSSDLLWDDTDKQMTVNGKTFINLATKSGTPSLNGSILDIQPQVYTDNSGGPTTPAAVFNSFSQPTLAASVATSTTTAATVYIAGEPIQGTNQSILNEYALWVDSGDVKLDNDLIVDGNIDSSGTITGVTLTDGTVSINSGDITSVNTLTATTVNVTTLSDGIATMSGGTVSGLAAPLNDSEAANKGYVDTLAQGIKWKNPVKLATNPTGLDIYDNQDLNGESAIDGVAAEDGDRVLVKDQWLPRQNGIWIVSTGAWSRASDMDEGDAAAGSAVLIEQGNVNTGAGFVCNNETGSDTIGNDAGTTGDDIFFAQFTGAGAIIAGDGLNKEGNTISVNVDDVTIEISSDQLQVKDLGITNAKIQNNSIDTNKIQDTSVTNVKLANSSITVTAGSGLLNGGSVSLGGTTILNIDSTVLRTTGNQSASGVQAFTNTTGSTNINTGAVVISGGLGVAENIFAGGSLTTTGNIIGGGTISDGTATLNAGNFTGVGSISAASLTATGNIQGLTLTDGTVSINSGSLSNVTNLTASGSVTSGSFTDGTAVLTGGVLTGLATPTSGIEAANKNYVDSVIVTAGTALEKIGNAIGVKVDDTTIEIVSDQLQVKNSSITDSKLATSSVTTTKILDSNVTNAKLANDDFTITAGDGLQTGGTAVLGGSVTLDVNSTVLRTTGDQSASGIQTFSNTTESTNITTGGVIISGGLAVTKNLNTSGDIVSSGTVEGSTLTDGTAVLTSGNLTGVGSISAASLTATGNVQGVSLTDGVATLTLGSLSSVVDVTASGTVTADSFSDGTATLSGGVLTGLTVPLADTDATNKAYVDGLAFGIQWKLPVAAATIGNVTLSGLQTIDTVSLVATDRVLVKDQINKVNNGIYEVAAGAWSRSVDMASGSAENFACLVEQGNVNIGSSFVITDTSPYTIGTSNLTWNQFASSGVVNAGAALEKSGTTINVKVDNTTIEVASNELQIKTNAISTGKIINNAITTDKIADGNVTNVKLQNSSITVTAGDGLQTGGAVSLGGNVTLDVDTTVLRTTGNQSASGIQAFTNVTESTSTATGSVVLSGGLAVAKNAYIGGLLDVTGTIEGGSLTDGIATLTGGNLSGVGSIGAVSLTTTGTIQGPTITDGTATMNLGSLTGVVNLTATGSVSASSFTNGTATLTGGVLSGLITPTLGSHATNKDYVDGLIVTAGAGSALTKVGTEFFVNVDNSSIAISLNELSIASQGVTTDKLRDDAVRTNKIRDAEVTNIKLQNSSVTVTAGDGLQSGGSVSLGGSVILDVDTTVLRTSGNQSASGIQSFTNTTQSTSEITGAVVISGGLGIAKDTFTTGRIETDDTVQGATVTDGTLSINSGDITGAINIGTQNVTATTQVQGTTVTDGTASLNAGSFTGLVNVTASGTITISPIPDDRILFMDNGNQITSSPNLTWDGTTMAATVVNTQDIVRPNGGNQSSLWTTGTGNIDFGLQTVGTIQMGSGPMLKLTSTTSILQSSLTIQGNLSRQYLDTTINTASNVTYTAQEVFNGIIFRDCNGADRNDTLPTAAALVGVVPEPIVGSSMEVLFRNSSAGLELLTLQTNTGLTLNESLTISAGITNRFIIVFTNVSPGTEAATVFASVPKDRVILQCSFSNATSGGNSTLYAQWGPPTGNTSIVDSSVLGYSGTIVQLVCNYAHQSNIGLGANEALDFDIGTADASLSTFTTYPGGANVVQWTGSSGSNNVNGTKPTTSSGSISIPVTATDRIAIRSQETGSVTPTSMEIRCSITFQLD